MTRSHDTLKAARAALERYDFSEAIALLDAHLATHPDDLEAELERGLAYLMAGDETRFAAVHDRVEPRLRAWPPRGGRLHRLWETYRGVMRKFAKAAAIVAVATMPLALSGCPKDAETTPPDRHPPARSVDAGARPAPDAAPTAPDAAPTAADAGPDATAVRPRPQPDATAPVRPVIIRPKYGVRLRYRVVRPHYRYGIRKPRTP